MVEVERELPFMVLQVVGYGGDAPWLVSVRGFTYRGK